MTFERPRRGHGPVSVTEILGFSVGSGDPLIFILARSFGEFRDGRDLRSDPEGEVASV
jgi:hypothetical protein